jgi:uncharacterized protein (TIGR03118 family)
MRMTTPKSALSPWILVGAVLFLGAMPQYVVADGLDSYAQQNLVSNIPGLAAYTDTNLVNPWGVSFIGGSPFWISDNGAGVSTLYSKQGQPQPMPPQMPPLVVNIPSPSGPTGGTPTGQVGNTSPGFGGAHFIFATEDGVIASWSGGTQALRQVNNSSSGAVYKGLAMGTDGGNNYLYATNFHAGTIDVFNSSFQQTTLGSSFTDPNLPAGYAPFNIQNIGGMLYVTYALQDAAKHDDVAGAGHGFVDVFTTDGVMVQRLVSMGQLNSPWGLALAPKGFGAFSSDLLVGNFGNGWINAYDPTTGAFVGTLDDPHGNPITELGLWDITFDPNGAGANPDTLYFTAGLPDSSGELEQNGLFGALNPTPEPWAWLLFGTALAVFIGYSARLRKQRL